MRTITRPTFWAVLLLAAVLAGCSSAVKRSDDPEKRSNYFARGGKVSQEVKLTLDKNAQAQLADNLKFDQDKLLDTVKRALRGKQLMAESPAPDLSTLEIVVTDIRVRSNFSAVMFGFMAGDDHIVGDVVARHSGGREVQRFQVSTSYALGGIGGGQDDVRMSWMYEKFAEELVNELTGASSGK